MSTPFYDLASLVVVPSGYKAAKIYAQKPQTADGQLAFTRASTATRRTASGTVETVAVNVPRLDYAFGATCPKLLLEPQRTNFITQSNDFSVWSLAAATATSAQPGYDGTNNAWLLSKSSAFGRAEQNVATSGMETFSVHVKAGSSSYVDITSSEGAFFVGVNLTNGSIVAQAGVTPLITAMGNGWYRISISYSKSATNWVWRIIVGDAGSTSSSAGSVGNILVQQAQAEPGAYPTSLIPTTATAVTRVADAASKTGISSLIGQTEGTLFAELTFQSGCIPIFIGSSVSGSAGEATYIEFDGSTIVSWIYKGGVLQAQMSASGFTNGQNFKLAVGYKLNDFALYVNGVQRATDTSGEVSTSLTNLTLNTYPLIPSTFQYNGKYAQFLLFKTRLTNAQLAELTA